MRYPCLFVFAFALAAYAADSTGSANISVTIPNPPVVYITAIFPEQLFFTSISFSANPPANIPIDSIVATVKLDKQTLSAHLKKSKGPYSTTFSKIPGPSEPLCSILVYSKGRLAFRGSSTLQIKDTKPISPVIELSAVQDKN
jgi:hypothetical protein